MSLKAFKWGIFLFMLMALGAWGSVIFSVDPAASGMAGRALFFGSCFAWVMGADILLLLWAYTKGIGEESTVHHLGSVFRQAFLITVFFVGNLFLLYAHVWAWWVSLLFFCFILLLELTFRNLGGKGAE